MVKEERIGVEDGKADYSLCDIFEKLEGRREKRKGKRIAKASRCWKIWSIDNVYTHIYIYTHTGSVCYRKLEEKTARGPTLCTFTGVGGVSHSVVGVSHLAAGSSFASISSHPNADDFAGSLSGVRRRLLLSHLLSHPYLEGGRGPRGCSFVSKSQDAAPVQSGRPIQTVRLITASLSIVFIYIHPRFASFVRERKEPRLDVESVARMESARVSLGARVQACRGRFAEHC